MNITLKITCLAAAAMVAGCASERGENEHESEGQEHHEAHHTKAEAKITEAEARAMAMTKVPDGIIKEGELENEKGKLIWSFDIARPDTKDITEVNIDAITGKIIAVDIETPKDQAKEGDDEKKEKKEKD